MRMTRWLCSAILLQFACAPLLAQAPAAADSPQAPASAKASTADYSKEPYVFELIATKIHFDKDGRGQRDISVRVKVQSESAVRELGLQVYPYDSAFESLNVLSAKVQKPDGTVVDTPPSDLQELDSAVSREAPMYTDQREKHIAVKSLSNGDILEVKLRWTIHDPIAPGYFWYDTSYFHDGICLKEVVEISVPRDL